MISDDAFVGCVRNAEHGHPDTDVGVTVRYLRFLDSVYSAYHYGEAKGSPEVQASRASWVLQGIGVTPADVPSASFKCWDADRVTMMRDFLWSDGDGDAGT